MIISEKQIMQLIGFCETCSSILIASNADPGMHIAKIIQEVLNEITNQQSKELKIIE